jgi:hypothetical protein
VLEAVLVWQLLLLLLLLPMQGFTGHRQDTQLLLAVAAASTDALFT